MIAGRNTETGCQHAWVASYLTRAAQVSEGLSRLDRDAVDP